MRFWRFCAFTGVLSGKRFRLCAVILEISRATIIFRIIFLKFPEKLVAGDMDMFMALGIKEGLLKEMLSVGPVKTIFTLRDQFFLSRIVAHF